MNKLLQTIKENDERFKEQFIDDLDWAESGRCLHKGEVKSYITQSRIKELEALVEMIENEKAKYLTDITKPFPHKATEREIFWYNQALTDIIQKLKTIIKELKQLKLT